MVENDTSLVFEWGSAGGGDVSNQFDVVGIFNLGFVFCCHFLCFFSQLG